MNREPDSGFNGIIGADRSIEVVPTPEHEHPENGSVTFILHFSKYQSTVLRITRAEALSAIHQLAAVLEQAGR